MSKKEISLLEKAQEHDRRRKRKLRTTIDEMELAIAYVDGKISMRQMLHALGWGLNQQSRGESFVVRALKDGLYTGDVTLCMSKDITMDMFTNPLTDMVNDMMQKEGGDI